MGEEEIIEGITNTILMITLIIPFLWGIVCDRTVNSKGYSKEENHGFLWGFLSSFIGVLLFYFLGIGIIWGSFIGLIGLIVCIAKPNVDIKTESTRYVSHQEKGLNYDYNRVPNNNISAGWVCNCGARNDNRYSNCYKCGKPKFKKTVEQVKMPEIAPINQPFISKEPSISDQIKEINKLKEEGLITEEEYTAKKKQILGI